MTPLFLLTPLFLGCAEESTDNKANNQNTSLDLEDTADEATSDTEDTEDTEDAPDDSSDNGGTSDGGSWDACDTEAQAEMLSLPASESEAGQLVIIPEEGDTYLLNKEATNEGWFILEVSEWMCDIELYTEAGVTLTIEESSNYDLGVISEPVSECEDGNVFKNSWTFHGWGSYVVHVQAEGQTDLWMGGIMVFNK